MKLVRLVAFAAALLAATATVVACGGDDGDGDGGEPTQPAATSTRAASTATTAATTPEAEETDEPPATATTAAPTTVPRTAAPSVDSLTVSAADFSFSPSAITVTGANDTNITLTNTGAAPHSMKIYRDQAFTDPVAGAETPTISAGASNDFTLTSANIVSATQLFFRCEIHPAQMQGTVAVQ